MQGEEPQIAASDEGEQHSEELFSKAFLDQVADAVKAEDADAIIALTEDLHAADFADLMGFLTSRQRKVIIECLGDKIDPELFHEVEGAVQDDLYDFAENTVIANAVTELESDEAVYVVEELDAADREEVLGKLAADDRVAIEESLGYPEDSAGRLMQRELVTLPQYWTVGQTIDFLRDEKENLPEDFYDLFVVDPTHRLVGVVSLSRVMRTNRPVAISEIMSRDVRRIQVLADQEDVAYEFNKYHLISAAVVDEADRIVGVITVDDVIDVVEEEAGEDLLALAGVGEAGLHGTLVSTARGRFLWLFINLLTALLASVVIGFFDATLEQMVALAVLMPVVASMGGNAGTQTMTVTVRAIATKEISSANYRRVLWREIAMAMGNGLVLSAISAVVAFMWFDSDILALIFAAGMVVNMLTAGFFGMIIPISLNRLEIDPAISSSVFVTTITDVVGFFAFLGLAALWLM